MDTVVQHTITKEMEYRKVVAQNLYHSYGLKYADMKPIALDDNDQWVHVASPDRCTDDGCEHYEHLPTGKRYVLDYHFKDNEWREYKVPKPAESKEHQWFCIVS
jgi:hypothetical protein